MSTKSRRSSTAKKSSSGKAPRTAPRGETAAQKRARMNRIAAERRAGGKEGSGTDASPVFSVTERGIEPGRDKRTEKQHRNAPNVETDTSVFHDEPPTGKQHGEGADGFPSGEYDVVEPAKSGVATEKSGTLSALESHLEGFNVDERVRSINKKSRLNETGRLFGLEALPVGSVIEHEAANRWRVKTTAFGVNRYGHGATASEAIEHYILGDPQPADPTAPRGESAADAAVVDKADASAKAPAASDVTDGAQKASARDEAGRSGARGAKGKARRSSGGKRSGSKK